MTAFDMTDSIAPASEQLDSVDLLSGARTFTIERVTKGNAEQPFNLHLADFARPWRPGKSMRRVLVSCWGPDAATYVGRRVELFCDTTVVFGGQEVGGTRISRLSHIDGAKKIPLLVSKGRSAIFVVKPLPDEPATPNWRDLIDLATTRAELTAIRKQAQAAGVTNGKEIDAMLATRAAALSEPDET